MRTRPAAVSSSEFSAHPSLRRPVLAAPGLHADQWEPKVLEHLVGIRQELPGPAIGYELSEKVSDALKFCCRNPN